MCIYIYIMYIQRTNIHMLMLNIPSMAFQVQQVLCMKKMMSNCIREQFNPIHYTKVFCQQDINKMVANVMKTDVILLKTID